MLKFRCGKKLSLFIEIHQNILIRVFNKLAGIGCFTGHISLSVHKLYKRQVVLAPHIRVILTKSRCDVHDTGTVGHCDIAVTCYKMTFFALFLCCFSCTGKERFIFPVFQIFSGIGLQHFISRLSLFTERAQHIIQQFLRHIVNAAVSRLHPAVRIFRIHTERYVRGQCPGSGRPCQKIGIFLSHRFKAHHCGTLFYRFIALRHLMGREGCPTSGTVRYDLKSFIKEFLIPDLL